MIKSRVLGINWRGTVRFFKRFILPPRFLLCSRLLEKIVGLVGLGLSVLLNDVLHAHFIKIICFVDSLPFKYG